MREQIRQNVKQHTVNKAKLFPRVLRAFSVFSVVIFTTEDMEVSQRARRENIGIAQYSRGKSRISIRGFRKEGQFSESVSGSDVKVNVPQERVASRCCVPFHLRLLFCVLYNSRNETKWNDGETGIKFRGESLKMVILHSIPASVTFPH